MQLGPVPSVFDSRRLGRPDERRGPAGYRCQTPRRQSPLSALPRSALASEGRHDVRQSDAEVVFLDVLKTGKFNLLRPARFVILRGVGLPATRCQSIGVSGSHVRNETARRRSSVVWVAWMVLWLSSSRSPTPTSGVAMTSSISRFSSCQCTPLQSDKYNVPPSRSGYSLLAPERRPRLNTRGHFSRSRSQGITRSPASVREGLTSGIQ